MSLAKLLPFIALVAAPVAGGLIAGMDRKLTARLQSRQGPPLLQPFYDVLKLLAKQSRPSSVWLPVCSWLYFLAASCSVFLFFGGADLLLVFFVQAFGAFCLVAGAYSAPSPYSLVGAQRELLQILAYEPLIILTVIGLKLATGGFDTASALAHPAPIIMKLPLVFLALGYALTVKLRKSPFDISASHHAHQELVRGVYTEYAGPHLALAELAHWYETVLILGLVSLFWATAWWTILVIVLGSYLVEIFIDNMTARLSWQWMLGAAWGIGITLCTANMAWLVFK